jgi:type II secretion system protein G
MAPRGKSGFTLIELLVVVAIVGLLATVALISLTGVQKRSRDTRRKADLRSVQKALDLYYQENGAFPSTGGAWRGTCAGYNAGGTIGISGPNGWVPDLAPTYIGKLPVDPRSSQDNTSLTGLCTNVQTCYLYNSNGTDYVLLAHCTPEGPMPAAGEPFNDPNRGYAFKLCNPFGAACAW